MTRGDRWNPLPGVVRATHRRDACLQDPESLTGLKIRQCVDACRASSRSVTDFAECMQVLHEPIGFQSIPCGFGMG